MITAESRVLWSLILTNVVPEGSCLFKLWWTEDEEYKAPESLEYRTILPFTIVPYFPLSVHDPRPLWLTHTHGTNKSLDCESVNIKRGSGRRRTYVGHSITPRNLIVWTASPANLILWENSSTSDSDGHNRGLTTVPADVQYLSLTKGSPFWSWLEVCHYHIWIVAVIYSLQKVAARQQTYVQDELNTKVWAGLHNKQSNAYRDTGTSGKRLDLVRPW
jgi:hypothetical protein